MIETPLQRAVRVYLATESIGRPAPLELETLIADATCGLLPEFVALKCTAADILQAVESLVSSGRLKWVEAGIVEAVPESEWAQVQDRRLFA